MKSFLSAIALILLLSAGVEAAAKSKTISIKTSAVCGSCKNRIEKMVKAIEGMEDALLNLHNKKVKVKFDEAKVSETPIRQAIANVGYDADDVKKDETAYAKLPACCQSPSGACKH